MTDQPFNAAEVGLSLVRSLETMGEEDERVRKWDELCATFWR